MEVSNHISKIMRDRFLDTENMENIVVVAKKKMVLKFYRICIFESNFKIFTRALLPCAHIYACVLVFH